MTGKKKSLHSFWWAEEIPNAPYPPLLTPLPLKISFYSSSWYQFIFVNFIFTYFSLNYHNYSMFRNVPECSGMFRDVPECSMFLILSTANKIALIYNANLKYPRFLSNMIKTNSTLVCPLCFFVIFAALGFLCHHCSSLHKMESRQHTRVSTVFNSEAVCVQKIPPTGIFFVHS